MKDIAVDY